MQYVAVEQDDSADSLAARIHQVELLIEVIGKLAAGKIEASGRLVRELA